MRLRVWKKEFPNSRPYLIENVIGQGWQLGSFLWLMLFLGVICIQAYFMAPILGSSIFKRHQTKSVVTGNVIESDIGNISEGIQISPPSVPYAPEGPDGGETTTNFDNPVFTDPEKLGVSEVEVENGSEVEKVEEEEKENNKEAETETEIQQEKRSAVIPFFSNLGECLECKEYDIKGRFTHYYPDKYPSVYTLIEGTNLVTTMNCWQYDLINQRCVSNMASDLPWRAFIGVAVACPLEFPLGTRVKIPSLGREYICLDRGSMICSGGVCDFDVLNNGIPFDGQVLDVRISVPGW